MQTDFRTFLEISGLESVAHMSIRNVTKGLNFLGSIVKILNSVLFSVVYLEHQLCAAVSAFAKVMDPPVTEDVLDMHPDTLNLVLEGFPAFFFFFFVFYLRTFRVLAILLSS